MPDTTDTSHPEAVTETDVRWHIEPYDADVDDSPKGDADGCTGAGDPVEGDESGAP